MKNKLFIGYLELALAQCCIGANINLLKILISHFPFYYLLFFRFFIGFIFSIIYLFFTKFKQTQQEYKKLSQYDWFILILQALCGGFLFNILTVFGLQYTTASVTGIINSAVPALVALFSLFILKEKLSLGKSFSILLCIMGIGILSLGKTEGAQQSSEELLGVFLIVLSIVPEAFFTILAKLLKKPLSPMATTVLIQLINALLFLPFAMINDNLSTVHKISGLIWIHMLLYGLSGTFFFIFWYRGLAHVSANTAALFMGIMPISTSLIAYCFLDEILGLYDMVGMLCVIISIFFGTRQRKEKFLY